MNLDPVRIHRILRGDDQSFAAASLRALTALAEPFYAGAMRVRNAAYDQGILASHSLGRPTISVGNITTGGTGKTPVVGWLSQRLLQHGRHPAVLMRGYRGADGVSDEQQLLEQSLSVAVIANADRLAGAKTALERDPSIDTFVLDDAFQHRRVTRDFDLVLINAADPFGGGRVLPRGLLREPVGGVRRASAVLITRASAVSAAALVEIEHRLRAINADAPLYRCDHVHSGLTQWPGGAVLPFSALIDEPYFAFCGLADPESFGRQLQHTAPQMAGHRWFADHHAYTARDLGDLQRAAIEAGAKRLVSTAKDWTKLAALVDAEPGAVPICVVNLEIRFHEDHEEQLLRGILQKLPSRV